MVTTSSSLGRWYHWHLIVIFPTLSHWLNYFVYIASGALKGFQWKYRVHLVPGCLWLRQCTCFDEVKVNLVVVFTLEPAKRMSTVTARSRVIDHRSHWNIVEKFMRKPLQSPPDQAENRSRPAQEAESHVEEAWPWTLSPPFYWSCDSVDQLTTFQLLKASNVLTWVWMNLIVFYAI